MKHLELPIFVSVLFLSVWATRCPAQRASVEPGEPEYESQESSQIIERMIEAHGGMKTWQKAPSVSYDFVMYLPSIPVRDGDSKWNLWRSARYALDMKSFRGTVELPFEGALIGCDGSEVWSKNYSAGNAPFFRLFHHATFVNLPWLTQHSGIRILEPSEGYLPGSRKLYHKLRLIFKRDGVLRPEGYIDLYVDPESDRLKATRYSTFYAFVPEGLPANFGAFPEVLRVIDEYAEVDGLLVPSLYQSYDATGQNLFGMHMVTNLSFSQKLDRSRLKRPSGAVAIRPPLKEPLGKSYTARKMTPPKIDGKITDRAWKKKAWDESFEIGDGRPPSQSTRFQIGYDADSLYIGLQLLDLEPDKIVKTPGKKDDVNGDRIAVFLDTNRDGETAYVFVINAAGVVRDQYTSKNGQNFDNSWEAEWEAAVHQDEKGWFAEMRIPLKEMELTANGEQKWGLQFTRVVDRSGQSSVWTPFAGSHGFVGSFGELNGIKGIKIRN